MEPDIRPGQTSPPCPCFLKKHRFSEKHINDRQLSPVVSKRALTPKAARNLIPFYEAEIISLYIMLK